MGVAVGVDSGGTFTDTAFVTSDGQIMIGKAFSDYEDPAAALLSSFGVAVEGLSGSSDDLLRQIDGFAYGTTYAINLLLTGDGSPCGLITTKGFEDTLHIARMRKAPGMSGGERSDVLSWRKPRPLLGRDRIAGVTERVDWRGEVVVALDATEVLAAADALVRAGAEALAVCFLWASVNPAHEREAAALIARERPDVPIITSSEISPTIGEYERMNATVISAYVAPKVGRFVQRLERDLRARGLRAPLTVTQGSGGAMPLREAGRRPVSTALSGPVAGITAARALAAQLGLDSLVTADVGGTSFDVGVLIDGEPLYARSPTLHGYPVTVTTIDIRSVGTGGGSIAWVDPVTGALRVGPESAGSVPGPACYCRGGTQPTLTDAAVTLGFIDPHNFCGGAVTLDATLAAAAIEQQVATPLGMSIPEAAAGIVDVATNQMADLVETVVLGQGLDPRDLTVVAYGGAGAQYAAFFSAQVGAQAVVVPALAPVFSAWGAAMSDVVVNRSAALSGDAADPSELTALYGRLEASARDALEADGMVPQGDAITMSRWAELRFRRQVHVIRLEVPSTEITPAVMHDLEVRFTARYEQVFGVGTAYTAAGIELSSIGVAGTVASHARVAPRSSANGRTTARPSGTRELHYPDPGSPRAAPVYQRNALHPGMQLSGPALVESAFDVAVVPDGQTATIDGHGNLRIEAAGS